MFVTSVHTEQADAGEILGKQEPVACDCWFTSGGSTMPRLIKYQDGEGGIRSIRNIRVLAAEDKRYCGIPTREYSCLAEENGREYRFTLIFVKEECRWSLIWN